MDGELVSMTRNAYDVVARSYARLVRDVSYEAPLDLAMIEHFVAQVPADGRVLDAGCGAGRMLAHLASLNPSQSLCGVDLSPMMVAQARAANPGIEVIEGDLAALGYADGVFDGILAWYSIIHTPTDELGGLFDEFHRVLKPRGLFLAGYQCGTGTRSITRPYGQDVELHAFLHRTAEVAAAAERAGFIVCAGLDREPRADERHRQGFLLARRR